MKKPNAYHAKVLLFGEYSVLLGSSALSIPYGHFQASLSFICEDKYTDYQLAQQSNALMKELLKHYRGQEQIFGCFLNLNKMEADIENGLYLESNIPKGYGLGSSGAVCAALYGSYAAKTVTPSAGISSREIIRLKKQLALMESYFHGRSSGFDPLSIYLQYPILIDSSGNPSVVGIPRNWSGEESAIFLLDTGRPGKTSPLVPYFLEKFSDHGKANEAGDQLIRLNNDCISSLFNGKGNAFWENLKALSAFQLDSLPEMIPDPMIPLWADGLEKNKFYMKLCGSGGGGYLTGFTTNYQETLQWFSDLKIPLVPVYQSKISSR